MRITGFHMRDSTLLVFYGMYFALEQRLALFSIHGLTFHAKCEFKFQSKAKHLKRSHPSGYVEECPVVHPLHLNSNVARDAAI